MYELAEKNLVLGRYATRYSLPSRMGKTLQAVRVNRVSLPTGALTEGTPPTAVALSVTPKPVTLAQWGIVVQLTDVAMLTTTHPMLNAAIERTSLAMSEMFEREIAETLMTGSNVIYADAANNATRPAVGAGADKISTAEIIGLTTRLRRLGAIPIRGTLYGGVIPPQLEADLLSESSSFRDAIARAGDLERLDFAKIGSWMGVEFVRSNFLPFFRSTAAPTNVAANATRARIEAYDAASDLFDTNSAVTAVIVGRDATTDYERLISLTAAFNVTTNNSVKITTPTNTDYVYDVYVASAADGTVPKLHTERVAANTAVNIDALPTGATPPASAGTAVDTEVFVAFVFGKDAFGRVELDGMSLQSYITPAGSSFSDPLAQVRKVGAKVMWASWLLDENFFVRFEAASAYASGLP